MASTAVRRNSWARDAEDSCSNGSTRGKERERDRGDDDDDDDD